MDPQGAKNAYMNTSSPMLRASWTQARRALILAFVFLTAVGCSNLRMGTDWPALDTLNLYGDDKIYVAWNDQVNVLEPSNGSPVSLRNPEGEIRRLDNGEPRRWTLLGGDYEGAQFFTRPFLLGDDFALIPAYNNRIFEVDLANARIESPLGIPIDGNVLADMAVDEDHFYVPYQTGDVAAIDRETYEVNWTIETEEGVWARPLIVDDVLYFGSMNHLLYAVDTDTGQVLWTADLEGAISSTPAFYQDHLYIGSFSHKIYKISTEGRIVDTYEGENWVWSTPVIVDDVLYYTDLSGFAYALQLIEGGGMREIWRLRAATRGIRAAPLVAENNVVVGSRDGHVYWLDRDEGVVVGSREIEGTPEILADLLLLEPGQRNTLQEAFVVVGTTNPGRLVVAFPLDLNSGNVGWSYSR